jgi:two-component system chemotaxis response regulator CheY
MARISIADDSVVMRKTLKRIIENMGHQVVSEASNGDEIIKQYRELKPDLITMDITMPKTNGIEAVRELCSTYDDIVIVMVSAINEKRKVFDALKYGAKHYIIKPFEEDTAVGIIKMVLGDE